MIARERDDEAESLVAHAEDSLTEDIRADPHPDGSFAIELRRGEPASALRSAESAVSLAEQTDALNLTAEALSALALACAKLDLRDRSRESLDRALQLYGQKGNVVAARRAAALLSEVAV
jgi:hypothetical protein